MSSIQQARVLEVRHWNDTLFSFVTTRDPGFRFDSGQIVTLGLEVGGRPVMRAYSMASPNHEEQLEFLSIKVPNGPLTSRLQHLQPGDTVLMSRKPTGSLLLSDLTPARRLYLFASGTGLAPFMSVVRDPETYERFEQVVLLHGVRRVSDLAYRDYLQDELPRHEYLGEMVRKRLLYCPTVTRQPFVRQGRVNALVEDGRLQREFGLPPLDAATDRAMICGSPAFLNEIAALLDRRGFHCSPGIGQPGDYVIERAFAEK